MSAVSGTRNRLVLIFHCIDFNVPEPVVRYFVCALAGSARVTELSCLLGWLVPFAATLHVQDLTRQLLLRHLVDGVLRVLILDIADNLVVVGGWGCRLSRLLWRLVSLRSPHW